ncbi:MAG: lytic transglycosylase [Pseudopedobacter saltans]|uniref:Lytic transglycosylase n=1 Tax=Pseudopedobacter saltans TaxID=151895 RepID=A0A2W5FA70_9SPHI|nr:MAG: lytic transglycosylase [Pseudopedobacter saltans]
MWRKDTIQKPNTFIIATIVMFCVHKAHAQKDSIVTKPQKEEFKSLLPNISTQRVTADNTSKSIHTTLNPQVVGFKDQYVKKEQHEMMRMKDWGRPYFHIYDKILSQYHLPLELKYLSVIESSLQSGMRSWAGAVGPWQLMYDEAMRYGLRVSDGIDERTDFQKSTVAAAKLLTELHQQFGDWLLVIAAYNAGPGAVRKAKRKAGSDDFWKLQYYLPLETRNHVKKFISTHYFFEGSGGVTTMTKNETKDYQEQTIVVESTLTEEEKKNTKTYQLTGFYDGEIICKKIGIPNALFNKLNPGFNKTLANGKTYELRLPNEKMDLFLKDKNEILAACFKQLIG